MSKDKKDYIILTVILALTVFSVILATAFNKGNGNLQTSLSNEKPKVEITKIVSVSTEGLGEDIKSYIKDDLTVVIYPKVEEKYSSVTYNLNIKNLGNSAVSLKSINITPKLGEHLLYTISNLNAGDVIEQNDSKMFSVNISYNNEFDEDKVIYNNDPIYIVLDFENK